MHIGYTHTCSGEDTEYNTFHLAILVFLELIMEAEKTTLS